MDVSIWTSQFFFILLWTLADLCKISRASEKQCGWRVTQKLNCFNLIISYRNGLDALWSQCHQIRHIFFFCIVSLHLQTSYPFLLYVSCHSLPGLQIMDYVKTLCEACPSWLWVTNSHLVHTRKLVSYQFPRQTIPARIVNGIFAIFTNQDIVSV